MKKVRAVDADDAPTRERVAEALLAHGPLTAPDLAERIGLTPAAVRRHLDRLLDEGLVEAREQRVYGRRSRGRPAQEYRLTDAGHDTFTHAYDTLAGEALRYMNAVSGPSAVAEFAETRLRGLAARLSNRLDGVPIVDRPAALADALSIEGFAASSESLGGGVQVCQHHCPVAHVAAEFPELCEAETQLFARVLGTHVQRLATIAHGDGVCTTHLPNPELQEKR